MTPQKPRRRTSVPSAKNIMRRAVADIVDPSPTDNGPLWDYFNDQCAYCGKTLIRSSRIGQVDHAEPGGGNHLGNLVLACARCNGDLKGQEPWQDFLRRTVQDNEESLQRETRIHKWSELHPRQNSHRSGDVERVLADIEQLINDFADKCEELRQYVHHKLGATGSGAVDDAS